MSKNKMILVFLVLTIFIGTAVRTYAIDRVVLWYDETFTLMHISGNYFGSAVKYVTEASLNRPLNWQALIDKYQKSGRSITKVARVVCHDHPEHTPGFYQALFVWAKVFGEDEIYVLRLLPVLFGVLCLPAFFWLTYELVGERGPACLATLMLCLSPLHVCYSQELREYSLFTLIFTLSSAAFLRGFRVGGKVSWSIYLLCILIGVYCTFLTLLVIVSHLLFSLSSLGFKWLRQKRIGRADINPRIVHLLCLMVSSVMLSPLLVNLASGFNRANLAVGYLKTKVPQYCLNNAWLFSWLFAWTYRPQFSFQFRERHVFDDFFYCHIAILACLLISIALMIVRSRWQFGFLLSIFLVFAAEFWLPDYLFGGQRSTLVRYFLPIPMIAIIPVSYFLWRLWQGGRVFRRAIATIVLIFLIVVELQEDLFLSRSHKREPFRCSISAVAKLINEHPDYPVIADLEPKWYPFPYALALGRLVDTSRPLIYVKSTLPRWTNSLDRAYVIHFQDYLLYRKYSSHFRITGVGPLHCGVVLINSFNASQPEPRTTSSFSRNTKKPSNNLWRWWISSKSR